jgi:hypothetical protein
VRKTQTPCDERESRTVGGGEGGIGGGDGGGDGGGEGGKGGGEGGLGLGGGLGGLGDACSWSPMHRENAPPTLLGGLGKPAGAHGRGGGDGLWEERQSE